MTTILLIIHLLIALALVGVILLQRSEGGALGIGGGGGLMSGRASANLLTRTTAGLAAGFIATSLLLAIVASQRSAPSSILDRPTAPAAEPAEPAIPSAPVAD
jgi:preprotein translocase subunit SecG